MNYSVLLTLDLPAILFIVSQLLLVFCMNLKSDLQSVVRTWSYGELQIEKAHEIVTVMLWLLHLETYSFLCLL